MKFCVVFFCSKFSFACFPFQQLLIQIEEANSSVLKEQKARARVEQVL